MAFKFEKLKVWQRAVELSNNVYLLTETFPKKEMYVLTSQMQRAADSVSLNIAEGSTGQSNKEFNRFLGYSLRSGLEVVNCLYLTIGRNLIKKEQFDGFYNELEEITKMIQGLRNSLK